MQQQRGNAVASTSQQQQQPSQSQSQAQPSSQSQTTTTTAPNGGGQEVDPTYKALELGSKVIDERLQRDERWSGVGDCLTPQASSDYVLPPNPAWAPFQKTRTVLLPDRLFEEHDLTQSRCSMGLLAEIDRAWVTVDHRLLLWDWSDGSSFSTFEELTDVIVGVALVSPKPGVFVDSVTHLLVLTTPTLITLVGISYVSPSPGAKKEITFFLTGLEAPTDGISLTTIKGTNDGRIFLISSEDPLEKEGGIGGDGNLYELAYQRDEGWFNKKCNLKNLTRGSFGKSVVPSFLRGLNAVASADWVVDLVLDNERGLLYTLLRNSAIEMYSLGSPAPIGTSPNPPSRVTKSGDTLRAALNLCPGSPMLNARNFKIVKLEIISVLEAGANKIALVAVTGTGVRLYFTHQRRSYYMPSNSSGALELYHVRPPPSPSTAPPPSTQQNQNSNQYYSQPNPPPASNTATIIAFNSVIQAQYSSGGLFLASNNVNSDLDVMLLSAPDVAFSARGNAEGSSNTNTSSVATFNNGSNSSTLNSKRFFEVASTVEIQGRTWDMAEITRGSARATSGTGLNELATQGNMPRREWCVLTNMGANVIARQRPVDTLLEVLELAGMNGSGANGDVGVFFESYGRDQSCAMLLTIAAGNSQLSLGDSNTSSFNGYNSSNRLASSSVAEHAKSLFFEGGGRPVSIDRGGYGSGQQATASDSKIIFSGRHEGLAFYFARLIRPIWKLKVTRSAPTMQNRGNQIANVSDAVLSSVQRDLISLRTFVEQEHQLFTLLPDGRANHGNVAYAAEHTSLEALRLLLTQAVEAISFILLLVDYEISNIVASCAPELQNELLSLTYQALLTEKKGRDVARGLVSAVINQQIGKQLSVDAISDTLQQRCGSFCSADDVLMYKAIEAIRRARDTTDSAERTESLRESLRLFIKAVKHLSFERLKEVCTEYNEMRYPLGVIDLALSCAAEWDPSDKGVSYWLDGCPPNDTRLSTFELRKKCNELVFETLELTDNLLNEAAQSNQVTSTSSQRTMSYAEADGLRTNAYKKALSVKDEFFHSFLYDWYLSRGFTDQLLEIRTDYLESYLSGEPATLEKADLLWQYYVRTARYPLAAHVLATLANASIFDLALHKRVEYLSLAVGNAKSQFPSSSADTVEFLTELEEKLEVALVQIEIYRAIQELKMEEQEEKGWLGKLAERLFTISELYSSFAAPLNLLEIILLIVHVSDHRDPSLVDATWDAILHRGWNGDEEGVASAESRIETVASKVVELGRRFHSSDVAFPLASLTSKLERYTYESRLEARAGWVPIAFRSAGVSWEQIFFEFDRLFTNQTPPWHTKAGSNFLIMDLTQLLEDWLLEATSTAQQSSSPYAVSLNFPATQVSTAVGKYLMTVGSGNPEVTKRLGEIQREIKKRF